VRATDVTHAYRDKILAPGGTKDAAELVKDFLGRAHNFKAFEKYLTEK
jgi:thimet oligopeptidase